MIMDEYPWSWMNIHELAMMVNLGRMLTSLKNKDVFLHKKCYMSFPSDL